MMNANLGGLRKRSEQSSGQTAPASPSAGPQAGARSPAPTSRLVFGLNSKTNRLKHDEYAEQRIKSTSETPAQRSRQQPTTNQLAEKQLQQVSSIPLLDQILAEPTGAEQRADRALKSPQIRASKYGNFYKPQDLTSSKPAAAIATKLAVKIEVTTPSNQQMMPAPQSAPITGSTGKRATRTKSPQRKSEQSGRASKSPSRSRDPSPGRKEKFKQEAGAETDKEALEDKNNKEQQVKMKFNIPPPPPMSSNSTRNSVVSYAKSRIYDKPAKVILSNPIGGGRMGTGSSVLDSNGNLPNSILCGFKPPKQTNVSKAREKWEGGEPFAKCKSRQRLAAQAGKKLLGGTWSMTSVVATQQLQLQQALAQSNYPKVNNNNCNNFLSQTEKVLTQGSVLERVQKFERAPTGKSTSSSGSSECSSSSSGSSSGSSYTNLSDFEPEPSDADLQLARDNKALSLAIENEVELVAQPTSKQAIYKSRVSSAQNKFINKSPSNSQERLLIRASTGEIKSTKSPPALARRLSLRRRSSSAGSSNNIIPRFYHPYGKPNTYEIELQKKNIVACFDKFPDRKAQLSQPSCRRHFHSIALACNLSEYFKEPLYLYVKHKMLNSNLLHISPATNINVGLLVGRKQSGAGLELRSPQQEPTAKKAPSLLSRAASIDNSTMEKIQGQNYISCDQFLICWKHIISSSFDQAAQFVHLLTMGQRSYLLPDDFIPLIQSIIEDHPGLKFLRAAPDFHLRYIQTVIARIYYHVNRSWTGKISLAELRRSNLLAVLEVLSKEEDINQITDYFSYEHFYVIYCKFWNLDQDHDLLISKEDLARHNDAAISSRIIDRIFMGIVSKQIQLTGKMSYSDFVWFLMAEEDKKHPRAVEYWFRLMDIDGDGYISMYEMEYFYYEQQKRLELMNIEALPFVDSACQILDLVNPKEKNKISLSDLKRTKMATIFFDTFINLEKYLEHESREFVSTRDVVQDGVVISDWDRYATEEYENLVTEETSV